jgi:hypothetical protein
MAETTSNGIECMLPTLDNTTRISRNDVFRTSRDSPNLEIHIEFPDATKHETLN